MKILPPLLALGLGLTLAACHKSATDSAARAGGPKKVKLAFVTNNGSDYWTIARAGCNKAVESLPNVALDFQIPSDGTAATQKRIVDDLLARGVDGIAISPVDPANQTTLLNDAAKQCLLLTQDSDAPASARACYLGTDNGAAGRQAGDLVKQALPAGGKIAVFVGSLDAQNAHERLAGLEESLKGSKVEIVEKRTDDADHVRAKANALDVMVKDPDIAALVGLWSYNGPALDRAVKDSNKVGAVKIICFDEEEETLQGVKDGTIFATVVQQPYEFGKQAIELMNKALQGDKSLIPADKKIIIPTLPITKDKVEEFTARIKALRGH